MFQGAYAFNQDINTKVVGSGASAYIAWDTSNNTTWNGMFMDAQAFNTSIDKWEIAQVSSDQGMTFMFGKTSVFNQDLLTKDVLSENSGITHKKSPSVSQFQDLDAVDGGNEYFHDIPNPGKYQGKQLGGKDLHERMLTHAYTNNGVTVGPSPGPSGHSEFQDLDKILPSGNESLGQFGGPYAYGVGPADGFY